MKPLQTAALVSGLLTAHFAAYWFGVQAGRQLERRDHDGVKSFTDLATAVFSIQKMVKSWNGWAEFLDEKTKPESPDAQAK